MKPPNGIYPDAPPTPDVRAALVYVPDAKAAIERAGKAWNRQQLDDAIASARRWLTLMDSTRGIKDADDGRTPNPS